jgi:hypothetical protein
MTFGVWLAATIVGSIIFLLGIGAIIWGSREESGYYSSLVTRIDLREFFSRWPPRPEPGALKTGGWIAIAVGLILAGIFSWVYFLK